MFRCSEEDILKQKYDEWVPVFVREIGVSRFKL